MRIISGKNKNKRLPLLKNAKIRPTSSKLREAIFNILQNKIKNSIFLDLFAGSGLVGIEALSRKASFVFFVEKQKRLAQAIKKNLFNLNYLETAKVVFYDAFLFLKKIKNTSFDIVFIDPPYSLYEDKNFLKDILDLLIKRKLLKKKALILIEAPRKKEKEIKNILFFQNFSDFYFKRYGEVSLAISTFK